MAEHLSNRTIQAFYNSTWNDISSYVASDIDTEVGIYSDSPVNRLASTGSTRFTIDNISGTFTPNEDFKKGTPILITALYGGSSKTVFLGKVDTATVVTDLDTYGNRFVNVEALDWMNYANNQVIRAKPAVSNKTIDQAVTSLLTDIAVTPDGTNYSTGTETFLTALDGAKKGSKYAAELNNLVMSELSYIYLNDGGKTLRVESYDTRNGLRDLSSDEYISSVDTGYALNDTGDGFALGDTGSRLIVDAGSSTVFDYTFDNSFEGNERGLNIVHGKNVINDITLTVYPRNVDLDPGSLYDLYTYNLYQDAPPIEVPALGSITLTGGYTEDVNGMGVPDAAINVRTPDPTLLSPDFLITENYDGSGANLYANLTHSFTGGANAWKWVITNSGQKGYIQFINIVGQPIFRKSPVETFLEDTTSQAAYGDEPIQIRQLYMQDLERTDELQKIVDDEKDPRNAVISVKFLANASATNMAGFIFTDVGDLVYIKSTLPSVDAYFYVQGMKSKITAGDGFVYYELILKEAYSFHKGLTPIGLRFNGGASSKNGVCFYPANKIQDLATKTISAWIYCKTAVTDVPIASKYDSISGHQLYVFNSGMIQYLHRFSTGTGVWRTTAGDVTAGAWKHIVLTYNAGSTSNAPVIYVNGVSKTVNVFQAPTGTNKTDISIPLCIGNANYPSNVFPFDFNGVIKDVRYYNRILTAAEVSTLYNNPNDYYSLENGLVFQIAGVKTSKYSDYLNNAITPSMKIIDNIYGHRGTTNYVAGKELIGVDPTLSSY